MFLSPFLTSRSFVPACECDRHHPFVYAARAISHFALQLSGLLLYSLHRPSQHPSAIAQKAGIGGVMNVGLNYSCVHAHLPALNNTFVPRQLDQPTMQFPNYLTTNRLSNPRQRFGVWHFAKADSSEIAIGQVGPYLSLQNVVAPVTHMLEQQQSQRYLGGSLRAAAGSTVLISLSYDVLSTPKLFVQLGADHREAAPSRDVRMVCVRPLSLIIGKSSARPGAVKGAPVLRGETNP